MVISTVICRVERSGSSLRTRASDTSCHSRRASPGRICTAMSQPALADFGPEPIYASRASCRKSCSSESGGQIAEQGADRLRLAALRTGGPGARIPGKNVQMGKRARIRNEAPEEERGHDGSGVRIAGDVIEVGDLGG